MLGICCVILLWHSLGLPYYHFADVVLFLFPPKTYKHITAIRIISKNLLENNIILLEIKLRKRELTLLRSITRNFVVSTRGSSSSWCVGWKLTRTT